MSPLTLAIAADHGGLDLKRQLLAALRAAGHQVTDFGTDGSESVDYPDYARPVAEAVLSGAARFGVLICGSGIGISIAANRFAHVRAALVHDAYGARMCRLHNDANVLVLGGRTIGPDVAKDCLDIFLTTEFEGGRHARRVAKLAENGER